MDCPVPWGECPVLRPRIDHWLYRPFLGVYLVGRVEILPTIMGVGALELLRSANTSPYTPSKKPAAGSIWASDASAALKDETKDG